MSRFEHAFSHGPALVCFVTGGDPTPDATPAILDALVEGGADVIELGMPFTDPMADGPAIQQANLRSLAAGTTTADLFRIAADFRSRHPDTPLDIHRGETRLVLRLTVGDAAELHRWAALAEAAVLACNGWRRGQRAGGEGM